MKHRARAHQIIEAGQVRINRDRVEKPSRSVKPNDILTIALNGQVKIVKVLGEADRRGPASAATLLYEDLSEKQDASGQSLC